MSITEVPPSSGYASDARPEAGPSGRSAAASGDRGPGRGDDSPDTSWDAAAPAGADPVGAPGNGDPSPGNGDPPGAGWGEAGPVGGVGSGGVLLEAVDAARAALRQVGGMALFGLSDADVVSALRGLEAARSELSWARMCLAREARSRDVPARMGASGMTAWLRDVLRLRPGDAAELSRLADALVEEFPSVGEELAAGRLTVEQAAAIVRAVRDLPATADRADRERAETLLLGEAETFDAALIGKLGAHIRQEILDRDRAPDADDRDPATDNQLTISDRGDGTSAIRGRLDAASSAALRTAVEALARPRPDSETGEKDPRPAARRRADALVELVTRTLDAGVLPSTGGVRPHITVITTLEALLGEPGAPPATTSWGLPLSRATLRRLACDSGLRRVLVNAEGVPLDVGRESRTAPPGLRQAVIARDRVCVGYGCDAPAEWCDVHHITWWENGGESKLDNLALLCGFHHREVHHGGWQVRLGQDRRPEMIPPARIDPLRRPRRNPHNVHIHTRMRT